MKMINKIILLSTLSSLPIMIYAANAPAPSLGGSPDISGTYQCKGYDPGSKANYANPITIVKNGDTYTFQWLNSSGYPFNLGTGIMNPGMNEAISVVFWDPKKSDFFGTMLYQLKPDGSLSGVWVVQATQQLGTENCTKSK